MSSQNEQANRFFTLTNHIDPLPFANLPGEQQESYLGPSQPPDSQANGCKLFYKDSNTLQASGPGPTAPRVDPAQPATAAPITAPRGPPPPRVILIKHHVYQMSAAGQIAQVNPRNITATSAKPWERVITESDAYLKTVLHHTTWPKFRRDCIDSLNSLVPFLGDHLTKMQGEGLLKWQLIIPSNKTFAKGKNVVEI
ncbi:hypothetical protein PTTG_25507 [Puccinia triticina 1-1 BBBD Race 1]|uniref:Uncharacterized protein n=1 Tax=Puccinia triticina (isolate 1-1 / race 1 (BBBD)) TaxID=630390 RepID=A0A180H348_PUCT1|nr:hypothetical protein PTTG_25507 [Puccinia triticina 1-1 BBBD Race 1]